ncbi:MAG: hypothetical protein NE330_05780 [Lentisphaeraceae bacterium]|nr:hypothetical protein [Lentisphaeraceae bacterium]
MHKLKQGQLSIVQVLLLAILCTPAAIASVTMYKPHMMVPILFCGFTAGIFLLRNPAIFFWGIVFTAPITDHLAINLGPFNVRPYNLLAAGGVCWFLLKILTRDKSAVLKNAKDGIPCFLPLAFLGVIKLIGALNSSNTGMYIPLKFPLKFLILANLTYLSCFIVYSFCTTEEKLKSVLKFWLHLSNVIIVLAIIQVILSNIAGFHYVHHRDVIWFGRPYSVFREPDVLGSFVAATCIMIIPLLVFKVDLLNRRYLLFTLGTNAFLMVVIFVRAAWLGFMVTAVLTYISFLLAKSERKLRPYLNKAILAMIAMGIAMPILLPSYTATLAERFTSISKPGKEGASAYRMMELEHMVLKSLPNGNSDSIQTFVLGHGDFTWSYWGPELAGDAYNQDAKTSSTVLIHPGYCMLLTFLFDNGISGVFLITLFFGLMLIRFMNLLKSKLSNHDKALLMATFLPQIVILICFQFSYDPITPFMWILTGVHIAWGVQCTNKLKTQQKEIQNATCTI